MRLAVYTIHLWDSGEGTTASHHRLETVGMIYVSVRNDLSTYVQRTDEEREAEEE